TSEVFEACWILTCLPKVRVVVSVDETGNCRCKECEVRFEEREEEEDDGEARGGDEGDWTDDDASDCTLNRVLGWSDTTHNFSARQFASLLADTTKLGLCPRSLSQIE